MNEGFGPKYVFDLFGIPITETVVNTWIIMAALMIFTLIFVRNFHKIPRGVQNVVEMLVETINNLVKQTMGENRMGFAPYMGTLLIFIGVANISGLIGLRPPTADINTTFALAIMTFIAVQFFGLKKNGAGYLKGFFEPFPLLFPLNVIGELANPISLSFRLFGNIIGGLIIMSLLYQALAFFSFIPIPALLHVYFDLFAGLLQSFIFVMLTMVFVSMAMD